MFTVESRGKLRSTTLNYILVQNLQTDFKEENFVKEYDTSDHAAPINIHKSRSNFNTRSSIYYTRT